MQFFHFIFGCFALIFCALLVIFLNLSDASLALLDFAFDLAAGFLYCFFIVPEICLSANGFFF
ncbi:MAG: hypothetical protein C0596_19070 [Marinilabiliales bacterium]|nr:MAG: hypothetical protein C0596_19070 [Marinilabiliales bacterium]